MGPHQPWVSRGATRQALGTTCNDHAAFASGCGPYLVRTIHGKKARPIQKNGTLQRVLVGGLGPAPTVGQPWGGPPAVWETPFSAHLRRSTPDGRRCRGPKGRGSRCEAARAAIRFGGQVREYVLKCTIAPGFDREGDPSSPSFSPCLSSPLPLLPFFPFSARGPGSQGGRRFVTMAHNRLLIYSAFVSWGRCIAPSSSCPSSGRTICCVAWS